MHTLAGYSDFIGIVGVILVLIAYYLLNTHKITAHNIYYQIFNLLGSFLILVSLFYAWNLSAVLIEVAWMIISLIGIVRIIKENKKI